MLATFPGAAGTPSESTASAVVACVAAVHVTAQDLVDGRTLHVYDTGGRTTGWSSCGTTGRRTSVPPGARCSRSASGSASAGSSYDRPVYGGSTPVPGRDVASAAGDVAAVADALGIERFAVDGPLRRRAHALACGAPAPGGCWRWSAWPGWRRSAPTGSTGSPAWRRRGRRRCAPRWPAARPRSATRRRPATTTPGSCRPTSPPCRRVVVVHAGRRAGRRRRAGGADRRRPRLRGAVGLRSRPTSPRRCSSCTATPIASCRAPTAPGSPRTAAGAELRVLPGDGHISVLRAAPDALAWLVAVTAAEPIGAGSVPGTGRSRRTFPPDGEPPGSVTRQRR